MSKRSISYGTILGILLAIIVFVIVIVVAKNIFSAANYAGRWECKFAYAIASPLGLFSQESVVVQDAAKWGMIAIGAAVGIVVGSVAVRAAYRAGLVAGTPMFEGFKEKIKVFWEIFEYEFSYGIKNVLASQKFKTFLKYGGATAATLGGIYALASVSNSIAENMQKPILDNLCKPKIEEYVDTSDFDDDTVLKMCINDLNKEVLNATKKEFIKNLDKDKKKVLCLLYPVAKLVIATYGETIGTSVRVGYGRLHYVLLVNYTLGKEIYLSDLLVVLDLMGVNQNKSYYDIIYSQGIAYAKGYGEIYNAYNDFRQQKGIGELKTSDKGVTKIMTLYTFMDNDGKIKEVIGNETRHNNILFRSNGYYMVSFVYDGQGAILINTIGTSVT